MKSWKVYIRDDRDGEYIVGKTLLQAVSEKALYLAKMSRSSNEQVLSVKDVKLKWSDGIFGAKGGVKANISCRCSTAYIKGSPLYSEFDKIYEVWIVADKEDLLHPTRHFALATGKVYTNHNGSDYLCKTVREPGCYVMERVKDGWTLEAHVITMYPDGTIEWDYSTGGHWPSSERSETR
ncbi:hypothetical protein RWV98_05965 [Agathobaculum sp. NTUH-O15-33]|uniref:hypothetical protein n=1 Tax=Agathobaculum sp. NTUH-O15-33 TaxID=3079302 RepID=UPI002958BA81|nr:hypothetical protein [Agathobaculum sp. NTUH-O15-33]WNX85814.1 hypothetical protein RWV98_05965 [Agathobaculum sp. NTUH-O15-33]